jgi:hypothetical protein
MTLLRRCLVLVALMFWQGGFTFYAAVVVPIGQQTLGSPKDQGFITRRVTNYLNLAGAISLLPLAWDAAVSGGAGRWRRVRWLTWLGMALALGLLVWLHGRLDTLLDPDALRVLSRGAFRAQHRWYLWVSTFQWLCAVVYAVASLCVWREGDRAGAAPHGGQA